LYSTELIDIKLIKWILSTNKKDKGQGNLHKNLSSFLIIYRFNTLHSMAATHAEFWLIHNYWDIIEIKLSYNRPEIKG